MSDLLIIIETTNILHANKQKYCPRISLEFVLKNINWIPMFYEFCASSDRILDHCECFSSDAISCTRYPFRTIHYNNLTVPELHISKQKNTLYYHKKTRMLNSYLCSSIISWVSFFLVNCHVAWNRNCDFFSVDWLVGVGVF
jgi:hypothetical protein